MVLGIIVLCILITLLTLYVFWDDIFEEARSKKSVKSKLAQLQKEILLLEKIVDSQRKENRFLLDVIELGLPYPTIAGYESDEQRIKAIIEKELDGSQE